QARRAGLRLTAKDLFLHQTVGELAAALPAGPADAPAEQPVIEGPAPLGPIQRWFLGTETDPAHRDHFVMSMLVELATDTDPEALATALDAVAAHHEALRTRFHRADGDGWTQQTGARPGALRRHDLSGVDPAARDAAMRDAALATQTGLDVTAGPVWGGDLFTFGAGQSPALFLAVHHLVVDGVSWRILLGDLEAAYAQVVAGRPVELAPVGTAFGQWAHRMAGHVAAGGLDDALPYWAAVDPSAGAVPVDRDGANTVGSSRTFSVRLGADDTDALLHRVPEAYRTQVNDVLLSALGRALAEWTGRDDVVVGLEGHGREEQLLDGVDLSRTVGWFTAEFPVALRLPATDAGWGGTLKAVKEQLRAVPHRGLSYGALRYLSPPDSPAAAALAGHGQPAVLLNYHGQFGGAGDDGPLYRAWRPGIGEDTAPGIARGYLLEITGAVTDGDLELGWTYSTGVHDEATVRRLAERVLAGLREIVAHCAEPGAGGRTPSDFPLARLDQAAVDRLVGDGADVEDVYPLTPLQAGMVFHSLVEEGAYVDQLQVRLAGVADPDALVRAWQETVDRNPVLRTAVAWQDLPEPVQVVYRRVTVPVTRHDLRGLPAAERDAAIARLVADDRAAAFDLGTAPLLRLTVARLSDDEVLLVWSSHHVILDGWSSAQVFGEVAERYAAAVSGRAPRLEPRRPFRDYLRWLSTQDTAAAERYWRGLLAGVTEPTPLPYDRPPVEAHRTESSAAVRVELPVADSARLHDAARRHGLTVNTVVQGAWAVLLARHAGADDVVFGTTVSGRPAELPGVESMVGMFINTVPTRITVPVGQDTASWLRELQLQQSESRRFDHAALAQLQAWSDAPPGRNLFDSMVAFENYPIEAGADDAGPRVTGVEAVDVTTFPLTLSAYVDDDRLRFELAYDPALFDEGTARALADRLAALLTGIAADPATPVGDLQLSVAAEADGVLTGPDPVAPVPVGDLLTAGATAAGPDAPAVLYPRDPAPDDAAPAYAALSYRELDARACRLARLLVDRGVRPEAVVALVLPRSVDMVVAQLAVLKAGGAYLPVDPQYPADRIALMLTDARPVVVLAGSDAVDTLAGLSPAPVLGVDADEIRADLAARSPDPVTDADRPAPLSVDHPAYVIFTSGSTGRPKGVLVTHRGLATFAAALSAHTGVRPGDRVLLFSSPSFDASVLELCTALPAGAALVVPPAGPLVGEQLAEALAARRVAHALIPPAALATVPADARLPELRTLFVGGDACPAPTAPPAPPGRRMINAYG
ncbi:MAG TPA: condensation domain-containing protein, partial [Pilimelia sp.]|nr:condensation domain-containing protein [Pilimelia sp.]